MRWCAQCVLPDTRPNLVIGSDGVCNACRAHQVKPAVDWEARLQEFQAVVAAAKSRSGDGYDCIVPVSGGKDSTWQVVTCLEAGLRVLAVTWRAPGRTEIGQRNLDNLISLGVDHIDYSIDPKVEARFMLQTLERLGSPAVPMHLGLFNIPLTIAVRFGVPLIIWGENSALEYGSVDGTDTGMLLDRAWLKRYGVTGSTEAPDWEGPGLSRKDLIAYRGPSDAELEVAGVRAVFLGHYFPWDPDRTRAVAEQNGFLAAEAPRTGLYAFADIDDDFISIHHWIKWYKFGFTRLFDNLSLEIRNGRVTRDAAIDRIRESGVAAPHQDINRFCQHVGIERERFDDIVEGLRNTSVWSQDEDGTWRVEEFLIDDWEWA